ncbi:MAG: ferrous iron transport protein A [Gemmatimonadaceae bacterium]
MSTWWQRFRKRRPAVTTSVPANSCPLSECMAGARATVICVSCPAHDARRLRTLGLFEGARVEVVDTCNGMLLAVCGSRLAVDADLATSITVGEVAR